MTKKVSPNKIKYLASILFIGFVALISIFLSEDKDAGLDKSKVTYKEKSRASNSEQFVVAKDGNAALPKNALKESTAGKIEQQLVSSEETVHKPGSENDWWYNQPLLESPDRFAKSYTQVSLDASCTQNTELNQSNSIEESFYEQHKIDLTTRLPEDLFYFTLTQFWLHQDYHYQFVAIWERDMPALYRYEFYRSTDSGFKSNVEPIDIPINIPGLRDVIGTNQLIENLINHFESAGAKTGARILESSINDPQGDQQITIVDSQLTKWHTRQFSCDLNNTNKNSYCICDSNNYFGAH